MPTTIKLKNSVTTTNVPSSLAQGEVAINVTDKKVWVGNAATTPVQLLGAGSDGNFSTLTVTGNTYLATSSGNVGIGTSSPFSASGYGALTINGSTGGISSYYTSGSETGRVQSYSDGTNIGVLQLESMGSLSQMRFRTNSAERMRIDSSGNVGIGTSSPSTLLQLNTASSAANVFNITGGSSQVFNIGLNNSNGGPYVYSTSNHALRFGTNDIERMRIDSSGNLLVGTTSASGRATIVSSSVQNTLTIVNPTFDYIPIVIHNQGTSGDNRFANFGTEASYTSRGSIDYNRGAGLTRYNTTSDATLKNLIGDSDKQKSVDILNSTKIREYAWKDDSEQKPQIGVIAQELYETYKGAVAVGGEDKEGKYRPWGVDKTAFTFHLIAGWQVHQNLIQEQQAIINDLKARIETLESK